MKTLIEFYDERPIENVLATEVFAPEETVFICPPEIAGNKALKQSLEKYCALRRCSARLRFVPVSLLDAVKVEKKLRKVFSRPGGSYKPKRVVYNKRRMRQHRKQKYGNTESRRRRRG